MCLTCVILALQVRDGTSESGETDMNTILASDVVFAGRCFPAGTVITPKGAPASGGYFLAMAELDGRVFLISVREIDTVTTDSEPSHMDINGTPIEVGSRVEGLDQERNGSMGTVVSLPDPGWAGVEWDHDHGAQWDHPCEDLRVELITRIGYVR